MSACKDCRLWNTEPFETQCDGVTPIEGEPQMGCCMGSDEIVGCKPPDSGSACAEFVARPNFVSVCMFCHQTIGPDQRPRSQYIEPGAVVSHGVCLPCAPAYCADLGLSEAGTKRIIAANTPKSKTQHHMFHNSN